MAKSMDPRVKGPYIFMASLENETWYPTSFESFDGAMARADVFNGDWIIVQSVSERGEPAGELVKKVAAKLEPLTNVMLTASEIDYLLDAQKMAVSASSTIGEDRQDRGMRLILEQAKLRVS